MSKWRCLGCGSTDVKLWQKHSITKRAMAHWRSCLMCGIEEESQHGRNWKSFTQKDGDPVKGAGQSPGTYSSIFAVDPAWFTGSTFTNTSRSTGKSLTMQSIQDYMRLLALQPSPPMWGPLFGVGALPGDLGEPKLEVCSPEVGEIVSHRMWRYCGGFVQSSSVNEIWQPGEVMTGELDKIGEFSARTGVYSWKTKALVLKEAALHHTHYSQLINERERREMVIGTVKLWGTVIEHEKGYRSENARIVSFDDIMAWPGFPVETVLTELRRKYGV